MYESKHFLLFVLLVSCCGLVANPIPVQILGYDTMFAETMEPLGEAEITTDDATGLQVASVGNQDALLTRDLPLSYREDSISYWSPGYVSLWLSVTQEDISGTVGIYLCSSDGAKASVLGTRDISGVGLSVGEMKQVLVPITDVAHRDHRVNMLLEFTGIATEGARFLLTKAAFEHESRAYLRVGDPDTDNPLLAGEPCTVMWALESYMIGGTLEYRESAASRWKTIDTTSRLAVDSVEWSAPDTTFYDGMVRLSYVAVSLEHQPVYLEQSIDVVPEGARSLRGPWVALTTDDRSPEFGDVSRLKEMPFTDSLWVLYGDVAFPMGEDIDITTRTKSVPPPGTTLLVFFDEMSGEPDARVDLVDGGDENVFTVSLGRVEGIHDVYIMAVGDVTCFWFRFDLSGSGALATADRERTSPEAFPRHRIARRAYSAVSYQVPAPGMTTIQVVSAAGRVVRRIRMHVSTTGRHTFVWDHRGQQGQHVAPGVYGIRILSESNRPVLTTSTVVGH